MFRLRQEADALEHIARYPFARSVLYSCFLGPEGCVLIDLIGRHKLPIDVFTLDTGFLFPETRELWRRLERLRERMACREAVQGPASSSSSNSAVIAWPAAPSGASTSSHVNECQSAVASWSNWST